MNRILFQGLLERDSAGMDTGSNGSIIVNDSASKSSRHKMIVSLKNAQPNYRGIYTLIRT